MGVSKKESMLAALRLIDPSFDWYNSDSLDLARRIIVNPNIIDYLNKSRLSTIPWYFILKHNNSIIDKIIIMDNIRVDCHAIKTISHYRPEYNSLLLNKIKRANYNGNEWSIILNRCENTPIFYNDLRLLCEQILDFENVSSSEWWLLLEADSTLEDVCTKHSGWKKMEWHTASRLIFKYPNFIKYNFGF